MACAAWKMVAGIIAAGHLDPLFVVTVEFPADPSQFNEAPHVHRIHRITDLDGSKDLLLFVAKDGSGNLIRANGSGKAKQVVPRTATEQDAIDLFTALKPVATVTQLGP